MSSKKRSLEPKGDDVVEINFKSAEGSVLHYYHFLLGALIPMVEFHISHKRATSYIIATDVGPMKRLLCEMPFNIIQVHGPWTRDEFARRFANVVLPAYDIFNQCLYDDEHGARLSKESRRLILSFFNDSVPQYLTCIPTPKIILIERKSDAYYSQVASADSQRAKFYKTSGSERRSIRNHEELASALKGVYGTDFSSISLERCSLYYQYQLFRSCKIVIAQHGAALANIFFMESSEVGGRGHVVEVCPPWSRHTRHFKNLAEYSGVAYTPVLQGEDHGDVSVGEVLEVVSSIVASWPSTTSIGRHDTASGCA